jgi:hypothetical protein
VVSALQTRLWLLCDACRSLDLNLLTSAGMLYPHDARTHLKAGAQNNEHSCMLWCKFQTQRLQKRPVRLCSISLVARGAIRHKYKPSSELYTVVLYTFQVSSHTLFAFSVPLVEPMHWDLWCTLSSIFQVSGSCRFAACVHIMQFLNLLLSSWAHVNDPNQLHITTVNKPRAEISW